MSPDVITVFGHSHLFYSYFVQAYPHYRGEFSHYVFVADDLILNPSLNESNICERLCCGPESSFLKRVFSLAAGATWARSHGYARSIYTPAVDLRGCLPSEDFLSGVFSKHGILPLRELGTHFEWVADKHALARRLLPARVYSSLCRCTLRSSKLQPRHLEYAAGAYSDFLVVSAQSIESFLYYCGIFTGISLFAEIAIPTALLYTGRPLVSENEIDLKGVETWTPESNLTSEFDHMGSFSATDYFSRHPSHLYVHPIKLSRFVR